MTPEQQVILQRARQRAAIEAARARLSAPDQSEAQRLQSMPMVERIRAVQERGEAGRDPEAVRRQEQVDALARADIGLTDAPTDRERGAALPSSPMRSAVIGGAQGATFGLSDEIMGGVGALRSLFRPGQSMGEGYAEGRDMARGMMDTARQQNPYITGGAEIGAAMALPIGAIARSPSLVANMGRGAAMGGGLGAVYGFGAAEGGAGERLQNAAIGGAIGGAAGAAVPAVIAGTRAGGEAVSAPFRNIADRLLNRGSESRAARALARAAEEAGISADAAEAALRQASDEGQDMFALADVLGSPGQRQLSAIVRSGQEASGDTAERLLQRQVNQPERLGAFVSDAFDGQQTAAQLQTRLEQARSEAARVGYGEARRIAEPVDIRGALSVIDNRLGPMRGGGVMGDSTDAALAQFRSRLAASPDALPEGVTASELSDFGRVLGVKQDVQDAAQAAWRAGQSNRARALDELWRSLDEALEAASPPYRQANDAYREASRVIDAIAEGQQMRSPGVRATDALQRFAAMTPEQQAAARAGFGDRLLARIEAQPGEMTNRARQFTSTQLQQQIGGMALDPQRLQSQIGRENVMFETARRALGGSQTADNLADMAAMDVNSRGAIVSLLTGRFSDAATRIADGVSSAFGVGSPQTRRLIAEALMSQDVTLLRRGLEREGMTQAQIAVVEQLVRQGMAPAVGSE